MKKSTVLIFLLFGFIGMYLYACTVVESCIHYVLNKSDSV